MKRELAFALEARSQFSCFSGRTRSAKSDSSDRKITRSCGDRGVKLVDGVSVSRRNKRIKTAVPDCDLVDKSKEDEELAVESVVNAGEEAAVDVDNAVEESEVAEVANVEVGSAEEEVVAEETNAVEGSEVAIAGVVEGGGREVEKVYVKRKKGKGEVGFSTPKRFTRSSLKEKDEEENVEELETPTMKKLELKMSKKIGLGRMPTNSRELLETGLLEGFRVYYKLDKEVPLLLTN